MHMLEPGSMKDGGGDGVVNRTRAMEALSPWLNHPRSTIIKVEVLVMAAATLLIVQLFLGTCRRRWHNNCFIKYGLQLCNGIMFPLIVYTLGTMQSSPVKNSSYPVWAAFLIMASAGTTAVRQYDFYDSYYKKYIQYVGELLRDFFYIFMFILLLDPNNYYNLKTAWGIIVTGHGKKSRTSSYCVIGLVSVVLLSKCLESQFLVVSGYSNEWRRAFITIMKIIRRKQAAAESTEQETTANDDGVSDDSDPHSIKGYKYAVCYRPCGGGGLLTIDQIWDCYGNSSDDNALKDLCLSYALSRWLLRECYFGLVSYTETSRLKNHDFVFRKLLPPTDEDNFQRAFRVVEVELGFCYDFFFTKYSYTFTWMSLLPGPFILPLALLKIIPILLVVVVAIRRSLVLETPNPIIEVHISKADYIITLVVLSIAFIVEVAQAVFYLTSNWAQVSLACFHATKLCREPNAFIFGKVIGFLRRIKIYVALRMRNKIQQRSFIFGRIQQPDPVGVSDAVKKAIARSLRSTYASNLPTSGETSVRFDEYSWALTNLSQLEVILIWHIATEFCNAISYDPNNGNGTTESSDHRGGHLFGYVLQWLRPDPRRNRIASDSNGGVAVHLSRYYAYLIGSVPELLPYHEVDIAELAQEATEERKKLFKSCNGLPEIYNTMKSLPRTQEEEDNPMTMFNKGVKLGKQLKSKADCWEVLQDFWAKEIIHAAAVHYTSKQHMQHLENGGEFLTHIWALLAHAGILNHKRNKDQEGQTNLERGRSSASA